MKPERPPVSKSEQCEEHEWNVVTEVSPIVDPPLAAGNFLVKLSISCALCGISLHSVDDGKVLPYLETVMFR